MEQILLFFLYYEFILVPKILHFYLSRILNVGPFVMEYFYIVVLVSLFNSNRCEHFFHHCLQTVFQWFRHKGSGLFLIINLVSYTQFRKINTMSSLNGIYEI